MQFFIWFLILFIFYFFVVPNVTPTAPQIAANQVYKIMKVHTHKWKYHSSMIKIMKSQAALTEPFYHITWAFITGGRLRSTMNRCVLTAFIVFLYSCKCKNMLNVWAKSLSKTAGRCSSFIVCVLGAAFCCGKYLQQDDCEGLVECKLQSNCSSCTGNIQCNSMGHCWLLMGL